MKITRALAVFCCMASAGILAGWSINSPVGDIQPFGGSEGTATDPNAVHITGTETVTGAKTFSAATFAAQGNVTLGTASTNYTQLGGTAKLSAPVDGQLLVGFNNPATTSGAAIVLGSTTHNAGTMLQTNGNQASLLGSDGSGYQTLNLGVLNSAPAGTGLSLRNITASTYGYGFADATHTTVYTNGSPAVSYDSAQNANFFGSYLTFNGNNRFASLSDGLLQVTKSDGTFASFLLGATGATTGVQLVPSANLLSFRNGAGSLTSLSANGITASNISSNSQISQTTGASAATPGIATSNTGLTGLYGPGGSTSNILGFSTNGTAAGQIDASQNWSVAPAASNYLQLGSTTKIVAPTDGWLQVNDSAATAGLGKIRLGGSTGVVVAAASTNELGVFTSAGTTYSNVHANEYIVEGNSTAYLALPSGAGVLWSSSSTTGSSTKDTGLARNAAGVVAVTQGSGTTGNGNMTLGQLQFGATTVESAPADGTLQVTSSTGTFGSMLLGGSTSTTGVKLVSQVNGSLSLLDGSGGNASTLTCGNAAGQTAISTLGQITTGEVQIGRAVGDAFRLTTTVHGRLSSDSQFGWASGNGANTTRDVSLYRSAAGVIGVNNGSGTTPNGDMTMQNLTTATNPAISTVNPQMYYRYDECDNYSSLSQAFSVNGTVGANTNSTPQGNITAGSNHPGTLVVSTTSSVSGGAITGLINGFYKKSSVITWRWRVNFQMPTQVSTVSNRYVFNVGSFNYNATAPWAGPYISYSDNLNSGNWTLNSSFAAGTTTTVNSATAAPAAGTWHVLAITLVNGVFTYVLDGTTLGTVTDTNLPTTEGNWVAYAGSIQLIPSSYTSATYAFMDSYDILVTGISR